MLRRFPASAHALRQRSHMVRRSLFISTEETPNPNTIKFKPGRAVLPAGLSGLDFRTLISARRAPLARDLMMIDGVSGCFLGPDFVSVTLKDDGNLRWSQLKPFVFEALMNFYAKEGAQAVLPDDDATKAEKAVEAARVEAEEESELVLMIKELLEEKVRPMARDDGGDVLYKGFDEANGVVKVQLVGSCVGCPSSTVTLKNGVENMLRHYIPEVKRVDAVTESEAESKEHHLHFNPGSAA